MTEIETRLSLLAAVLTSCTDAYKENVRIASLLEDKAQKTGAFAGLFIAAAFGFAKRDNIHDVIALAGNIGILVMILCLLFFLACVFQCLRVMWVQSTVGPVNPEQLFAITNALLNLKEPLLGEKTENHSRDQIHGWIGILRRQQGLNGVKAARLLRAQWILAIGMMMLGVLLILLTTHVTKGK